MLFRKALWRMGDSFVQWLWFLTTVRKDHIGYDRGLLTWLRVARHRKLRKRIHICLLDLQPRGGKFGRFTSFWINERSAICSASVNERIEDADVVWTYSQDPLSEAAKREIHEILRRKKPETPVINRYDSYNAYHEDTCFKRLRDAGVSVPRSEFSDSDIGRTLVVYKVAGKHGSSKFLSLYRGPIEGYRPFEFWDSRASEGMYRKYRVFYILGNVIPYHFLLSDYWNVHRETRRRTEYIFDITECEIRSIRLVAQTLGLEFFAVDFIRKSHDDSPVFTDINVYPLPIAHTETARERGYFGRWTVFDTHYRLGLPEPNGDSFWSAFDAAMMTFAVSKDISSSEDSRVGQEPN